MEPVGQLYASAAAEGSQAPLVLAPLRPLQRSRVAGGVLGSSPSLICILAGMDQKDTYAVGFGGYNTFALYFFVSGVLQFQFIDRVMDIPVLCAWICRPSLEPEVQWGVCVHSSIAEPTVMFFTVLVNGFTIVATAVS